MVPFCRYLAEIELRKKDQIQAKHFSNLSWMRKHRFGTEASVTKNSIVPCKSIKVRSFRYGEICFG